MTISIKDKENWQKKTVKWNKNIKKKNKPINKKESLFFFVKSLPLSTKVCINLKYPVFRQPTRTCAKPNI